MKNKLTFFLILVLAFLPINTAFVKAANIEDLQGIPVAGDYSISPGKTELNLDPGQSAIKSLTVTNRYGKDMVFSIEIEDFTGSRVPGENIKLLGNEKGPYSLKDFLHPEMNSFVLRHGQKITLPVSISVPADAQPGGLYGSVIVTAVPVVKGEDGKDQVVSGNVAVVTRLASLYFVRVSGPVKEDGSLKEFLVSNKVSFKPDLKFSAKFENNGNVYLNPYGVVEIHNLIGDKIDEIKLDPYFVMPDSMRIKDLSLKRSFMFGMYTAKIFLNRGYGNVVDEQSVSFWVLPWLQTALFVLVVFLALLSVRILKKWFNKNFERKSKS